MPQPPAAAKHYLWSAALGVRAVREARKARPRGSTAVAGVVVAHQATAAFQAPNAVAEMLEQQSIEQAADALLNSVAFTTEVDQMLAMLEDVSVDYEFDRLVSSLVHDAGMAAESVTVATYPRIGHVRYLNPPSCSRCAVLAGRVYRYSSGFLRHPGCDCVMIPTTLANDELTQDPVDLMERGLVTGLSKADQRAIRDGADFGQVVNVRLRNGGVRESGRVLARASRPTPEAIYRMTSNRDEAVELLARHGYVR